MSKKYPSIDDNKYYDKISKIYEKYKIPKQGKNAKAEDYCKPKEFTLQPPQMFLPSYINPDTPYKSILVYHKIGAGKTCAAIQIAERWKKIKRIIFVLPASLKGNLKSELRSECGNYLTDKERKLLAKLDPKDKEYKDIIKKSDKRIEEYYDIYSYNKFIDLVQNDGINLKNKILIIDEIQNMVSETGTYYKELYDLIQSGSNNLRIILMSATPMFDRPVEIALTMNLLNLPNELPLGKEFEKLFIKEKTNKKNTIYEVQNMDKFKEYIKGYVSFFSGAPSYTFPEMTVKYVNCEMSEFQYDVYQKISRKEDVNVNNTPSKEEVVNARDLPNNFYIGTRFASNIVYPNRKVGDAGLESLTPAKIINNLQDYSCKFDKIMSSVQNSKGKIFIYSAFKEHAGLKSLVKVLDAFGYKNYQTNGTGKKRYAVWSGDESINAKDEIKEIFNRSDNLYGNKLKIILGSPAIKEGISLKAVRTVHILEPYWNQSRLDQVIGRANRFCSHIGLPEEERNVKVYVYVSVSPDKEKQEITVDEYVKKLSETKNKIIKQFEKAIIEAAVDCRLNKNANEMEGDEINCL